MIGISSYVALETTIEAQLHSYQLENTSPVSPYDARRVLSTFVFVLVTFCVI